MTQTYPKKHWIEQILVVTEMIKGAPNVTVMIMTVRSASIIIIILTITLMITAETTKITILYL